VTVPIEIVGTSPIIEIQVNGEPVSVHFDLGNADSVSLFPAFLNRIEKVQVGETGGRKSLYGSEDGKLVIDYRRKELTIISPDVPDKQQSSCRGREISLMPSSNADVELISEKN
jgi:hypothetical protein